MAEPISTTVSVLTAVGLGGILGAYFQARFQRSTQINQQEHELKRKRYLCILMIMIAKLQPEEGLAKLRSHRPDLATMDDINDELNSELLNGFIYADDEVLNALAAFIQKADRETFLATATAMRMDLWGKKTSLKASVLETVGQSIPEKV
jgi:hypothetical protein